MSIFDWLEIGAHTVHLIGAIASPLLAVIAWVNWTKGNASKAIYLMAWAIFAATKVK